MAAETDLTQPEPNRGASLIDVTSLIGAEEFIRAQNNHRAPADPFGRQCFVEVIQSLILMSTVYVAHPTLAAPRGDDFGKQPRLLRALLSRGLLTALTLDAAMRGTAQDIESSSLQNLQSADGLNSVVRLVTQAQLCDRAGARTDSLSGRMRGWSSFQEAQVHGDPGHHGARIQTNDGIEDDPLGEWARAAAVVLRGTLGGIAAPGAEAYLMATLARGIRYRARADAAGLSYQSHPMRRDFLLTFELTAEGAEDNAVLDVIKVVRGIQTSLVTAGGESAAPGCGSWSWNSRSSADASGTPTIRADWPTTTGSSTLPTRSPSTANGRMSSGPPSNGA